MVGFVKISFFLNFAMCVRNYRFGLFFGKTQARVNAFAQTFHHPHDMHFLILG